MSPDAFHLLASNLDVDFGSSNDSGWWAIASKLGSLGCFGTASPLRMKDEAPMPIYSIGVRPVAVSNKHMRPGENRANAKGLQGSCHVPA